MQALILSGPHPDGKDESRCDMLGIAMVGINPSHYVTRIGCERNINIVGLFTMFYLTSANYGRRDRTTIRSDTILFCY
jgi:hypothetical protein